MGARMALTDAAIRALRPAEKTRKVSDGEGLYIEVTPGGSKLWRIAYRLGGKQRLHSIGAYPAYTLEKAREERRKLKRWLAEDRDPAHEKRVEAIAKAAERDATFKKVSAAWIDRKRKEGKAPRTIAKLEWLNGIAVPKIGNRPVAEITPAEILAVLQAVEAQGHRETARRLRGQLSEIFRYAVASTLALSDPAAPLRGALTAPVVVNRPAIVEAKPFGGLLRAIDGYEGQITTRAGLQLLALTALRPGELRLAHWDEIRWEEALWVLPVGRMKQRKPFAQPLSRQALAILTELRTYTGGDDNNALIFPGFGKSGGGDKPLVPKPMSENTLGGGLRRLGFGNEEHVAHGFRSSFSTLMHGTGRYNPDHIEAALSHYRGDVRSIYDRNTFLHERVPLMQAWADMCDAMKAGGKVVPLARKAG